MEKPKGSCACCGKEIKYGLKRCDDCVSSNSTVAGTQSNNFKPVLSQREMDKKFGFNLIGKIDIIFVILGILNGLASFDLLVKTTEITTLFWQLGVDGGEEVSFTGIYVIGIIIGCIIFYVTYLAGKVISKHFENTASMAKNLEKIAMKD